MYKNNSVPVYKIFEYRSLSEEFPRIWRVSRTGRDIIVIGVSQQETVPIELKRNFSLKRARMSLLKRSRCEHVVVRSPEIINYISFVLTPHRTIICCDFVRNRAL